MIDVFNILSFFLVGAFFQQKWYAEIGTWFFTMFFFLSATSKGSGFSTCKSGDTAGPEEWRKALEEVETRMAFEGPQGCAGNTNSDQSAEKNLFPKGAIRGIQPKKDLKFRVFGIWMEFEVIFPDGYII